MTRLSTKHYGLMALLAIVAQMMTANDARADHLEAPENVTCELEDGTILVEWDAVDGAVKYSVAVEVLYDTDGDGEPDALEEFDFGTSDRTDGGEIGDPNLTISLDDLVVGIDTDDDGEEDTFFEPAAIRLKVKGLDPGKGKGRQNHPFSDLVLRPGRGGRLRRSGRRRMMMRR